MKSEACARASPAEADERGAWLHHQQKGPMSQDQFAGQGYVVLGADAYNELMELWEDEQAGRTLARLIKENKSKKFIPWEKVRDSVH